MELVYPPHSMRGPSWKVHSVEISEVKMWKLEGYVRIAFDGDTDLWEKCHPFLDGFEDAVNDNLSNVYEMAKVKSLFCYSINYLGKPIGFFVVVEGTMLYSFGINKEYRTKEIVSTWFSMVKELLGSFIVYLYKDNKRAIEFFKKSGMVVFLEEESNVALKI